MHEQDRSPGEKKELNPKVSIYWKAGFFEAGCNLGFVVDKEEVKPVIYHSDVDKEAMGQLKYLLGGEVTSNGSSDIWQLQDTEAVNFSRQMESFSRSQNSTFEAFRQWSEASNSQARYEIYQNFINHILDTTRNTDIRPYLNLVITNPYAAGVVDGLFRGFPIEHYTKDDLKMLLARWSHLTFISPRGPLLMAMSERFGGHQEALQLFHRL